MKIAEIRQTIRSAGFSREWLTGGTADEFIRQNVGPTLSEKVAEMRALVIAPRFADDIIDREAEIRHCESTIARWEAAQPNGGVIVK